MSRIKPRRVHLRIALAAVFAIACSKSDAPPADSAAANAAATPGANAAPQALVGAAPQRAAMPGELTKPLDSYTGDEFYALVSKLTFEGGHERPRNCKNDPGCGGTKKTAVLVEAIATQDSIGPTTMPQYGVVYIHAVNKGDAEEARYSMLPRKDRYEYYLILTNDSAGTSMNWRLEQFDMTPNARKHTSVGTGKFIPCNHPWVKGARADFKTCQDAAAARDSTVNLGLMFQGGGGDPIWAECAMGCCTAG